eukprot:COSAG01_NODE_29262_length_641_cov_1.616236_1_plen_134_part_10
MHISRISCEAGRQAWSGWEPASAMAVAYITLRPPSCTAAAAVAAATLVTPQYPMLLPVRRGAGIWCGRFGSRRHLGSLSAASGGLDDRGKVLDGRVRRDDAYEENVAAMCAHAEVLDAAVARVLTGGGEAAIAK